MSELSVLLIGFGITLITQATKHLFGEVNPLIIVAVIAIIVGFFDVFLIQSELIPADFVGKSTEAFASAVVIYNIIKQFAKK